MSYSELPDGVWDKVPARGHKNQCCDCGLVHRIEYRLAKDGSLEVRYWRDNRATAAVRRAKKATP